MWRKSSLQHFDLGAVTSSLLKTLPLPLPSIQPTWPSLSLSVRGSERYISTCLSWGKNILEYGKTVAFSFKSGILPLENLPWHECLCIWQMIWSKKKHWFFLDQSVTVEANCYTLGFAVIRWNIFHIIALTALINQHLALNPFIL